MEIFPHNLTFANISVSWLSVPQFTLIFANVKLWEQILIFAIFAHKLFEDLRNFFHNFIFEDLWNLSYKFIFVDLRIFSHKFIFKQMRIFPHKFIFKQMGIFSHKLFFEQMGIFSHTLFSKQMGIFSHKIFLCKSRIFSHKIIFKQKWEFFPIIWHLQIQASLGSLFINLPLYVEISNYGKKFPFLLKNYFMGKNSTFA